MNPNLRFLLACAAVAASAAICAGAQTAKTAKGPQVLAAAQLARTEAYNAIKAGDLAGGISRIESTVRSHPRLPPPDIQVAVQLNAIVCSLHNERDAARARQLASATLTRLVQPQTRFQVKDAVVALMLTAELYEDVLGDAPQAKRSYQQVLAIEPRHRLATDRLAHLKAVEDHAAAKLAASTLLKGRALEAERAMRSRSKP